MALVYDLNLKEKMTRTERVHMLYVDDRIIDVDHCIILLTILNSRFGQSSV